MKFTFAGAGQPRIHRTLKEATSRDRLLTHPSDPRYITAREAEIFFIIAKQPNIVEESCPSKSYLSP